MPRRGLARHRAAPRLAYKVRDPKGGPILTVPARRPVYIRALVELAERARKGEEDA
ncbi:MAG: hypothetical protein ACREE4_14315 [Stellaceae bacterium]